MSEFNIGKLWYLICNIYEKDISRYGNFLTQPIFDKNMYNCIAFFIRWLSGRCGDKFSKDRSEILSLICNNDFENIPINEIFKIIEAETKYLFDNYKIKIEYQIKSIDIVGNINHHQ